MKVGIGITKWDSKAIHFDEGNIINITPQIPRTCKWQHQNLVFNNAVSLIVPEIERWSWERKGSRPLMSFTFPFSTSQASFTELHHFVARQRLFKAQHPAPFKYRFIFFS